MGKASLSSMQRKARPVSEEQEDRPRSRSGSNASPGYKTRELVLPPTEPIEFGGLEHTLTSDSVDQPPTPEAKTLAEAERRARRDSTLFGACATDEPKPPAVLMTTDKMCMLLPSSSFRKKWDLSQAIVLLYVSISVPIRVGFNEQATGALFMIDFLVDMYFWADIGINFMSAFEDAVSGKLVTDRCLIAEEYARGWLCVDLIASVPVDLAMQIQSNTFECSLFPDSVPCPTQKSSAQLLKMLKIMRLVRLVKILRLARITRIINRYQDELFNIMPLITLTKLVLTLFFLGHFFACFFYYVSLEEHFTAYEKSIGIANWVGSEFGGPCKYIWANSSEPLQYTDEVCVTPTGRHHCNECVAFRSKYVACLYWAFTTMTTVGYGDISAKTVSERVFAIVGMLVGGFVFSILISYIGQSVMSRDLSAKEKKDQMEAVGFFVRDRSLPKILRNPLLAFSRKQVCSWN
jgi:hypothetical protein